MPNQTANVKGITMSAYRSAAGSSKLYHRLARSRRPKPVQPHPRRRSLQIESLESRLVLSNQLVAAFHSTGWPDGGTGLGISENGRYVVYATEADNVLDGQVDSNNGNDIFLFDRDAPAETATILISRAGDDKRTGNGVSTAPVISPDGRFVAYVSRATNLISDYIDQNAAPDVFLYDVKQGTTELLSRKVGGALESGNRASYDPVIAMSENGGKVNVAFVSEANNLMDNESDVIGHAPDVFLFRRDSAGSSLTLVSHDADDPDINDPHLTGNSFSNRPVISADGTHIAYISAASNLVTGQVDSNGKVDVFLYDVDRPFGTILVSHVDGDLNRTPDFQFAGYNEFPFDLAISANGQYVAFHSFAKDLAVGQTLGGGNLFLFDRGSAGNPTTTTLVSHRANEPSTPGDWSSFNFRGLAISADGKYLAFTSDASDLVDVQTDDYEEDRLFLFNRELQTNTLVHRFPSASPGISADGRYIAFTSVAPYPHVMLFDQQAGSTTLVSHSWSDSGTAHDGANPVISRDGSHVAYDGNRGRSDADGITRISDHGIFEFRFDARPTAAAGGPYFMVEGESLRLDALGSLAPDTWGDHIDKFEWDLDDDGEFDDASDSTPLVSWTTLKSFGIGDGLQEYPIQVRVTSDLGEFDTDSTIVTVTDLSPTIELDGEYSVLAGSVFSLQLGSVNDPGDDSVSSFVVDWGDGTSDNFSESGEKTHIYSQAGDTVIRVDLVDEDDTHLGAGLWELQVAEVERFVVANTLDSGVGSLRQAIIDANLNPGLDTITFSVGSGVQTIIPTLPLPEITEPVVIDGWSQPGYAGTPLIALDGADAGSAHGLVIKGGLSTIRGLIIHGFDGQGIYVLSDGNTIQGNYIGVDIAGASAVSNRGVGVWVDGSDNLIGGTGAGEGNVISGNGIPDYPYSIQLAIWGTSAAASNNVVQGNLIGTDASGMNSVGEFGQGITIQGLATHNLVGGVEPGAGNVLSGNRVHGVGIGGPDATQNVVQGNLIGTTITGTAALANGDGVVIDSPNNTVGGTTATARNIISGNTSSGLWIRSPGATGNVVQGNAIWNNSGAGVVVAAASNNRLTQNEIHNNDGIGIDLGEDGVSQNDQGDVDDGPNQGQNFPVIALAVPGDNTRVAGTLSSRPNTTYHLEFYANAASDASGYGEGQRYLGSFDVTTDATGIAAFDNADSLAASLLGEWITSTATDADGNTSEFSLAVLAGGDIQLLGVLANETTSVTVTYRLTADMPAFELGLYISQDTAWDNADNYLGSVTISDSLDLTAGVHAKVFELDGNQFVLPGVGAAELDEDYYVLVVADPIDLIVEDDTHFAHDDNTAVLNGAYLGLDNNVYVHGTDAGEQIHIDSTDGSLFLVVNDELHTFGSGISSVRLRTHGGDDVACLTPDSQLLENLGNLFFYGNEGHDVLVLNDQSNNEASNYTLSSTHLTRTGSPSIDYSGVELVEVNSGPGAAKFKVLNTSATTETIINAGGGSDTILVGTLDQVLGPLTLIGDGEKDILKVTDLGAAGDYTVTANSLLRSGSGLITFAVIETISLTTSNNDDTIRLTSLPPATTKLNINAGLGDDTLIGPDTTTTWKLAGANAGKIGSASFKSAENLRGGARNDTFVLANGTLFTGSIDGGAGINKLDYKAYSTAISVDLTIGVATGVSRGILNVVNVSGGAGDDFIRGDHNANELRGSLGNDILLGLESADKLYGGYGRDLLVGGSGKDQLTGNDDDDLLIGDIFDLETNDSALQDILNDWQRTDLAYLQRRQLLEDRLTPATIHDEALADVLTGAGGLDWFWAFAPDITDRQTNEHVNP